METISETLQPSLLRFNKLNSKLLLTLINDQTFMTEVTNLRFKLENLKIEKRQQQKQQLIELSEIKLTYLLQSTVTTKYFFLQNFF